MSTFMDGGSLLTKWDESPDDEWVDQSCSRSSVGYGRTSSLSAFSAQSAAANMSRLKLEQHDQTLEEEQAVGPFSLLIFYLFFFKFFTSPLESVPECHDKLTKLLLLLCMHPELEIMKDKFSKLLLGEDMSGSGKGVCTALAVSNAMTNLYGRYIRAATVFGQLKRLEPLPSEKKSMWKRETGCLLSICEFIVDDVPSSQILPDGNIEVTLFKPRSDICMNLPALKKLDAMLLDVLDGFHGTEFWYKEKGSLSGGDGLGSFNQRNEDKWWLLVPCVPPHGLSERTRKQLQQKRESAIQMHKAARAINAGVLTEMEIPETYMATLPKCGRAGVGDAAYRYMCTSEQFLPDHLLDCLQIKTEHDALDVADRMETSMCVWKRKASIQGSKSSWMGGADDTKNETLASRAESIMLCLKQRYPQLSQTTLDTCKIQYNKDVGQAILESYSRVLESLAFNVAARIEDVLCVDESARNNSST